MSNTQIRYGTVQSFSIMKQSVWTNASILLQSDLKMETCAVHASYADRPEYIWKFHNLEAKVPKGRWRQRKHQNIPWDSRPIAWHTPQPRHFPCHFKQRHLTKILRFPDQWQGHPSNRTDAQHPFLVKKGAHGHCPIVVFDNVFKFIAKDGMYKSIKTKLGSQNIFGANYNSLTWSNMASRDFKKSRDKRPKGGCPSYPLLFSSLSRVQRRCGLFEPSHRAII